MTVRHILTEFYEYQFARGFNLCDMSDVKGHHHVNCAETTISTLLASKKGSMNIMIKSDARDLNHSLPL